MFSALTKCFDQFFSGTFWGVTAKSLALAVPLFVLAIWLGGEAIAYIPATGWGWLDRVIDALGWIGVVVLAIFIFPALSALIMGLFLDDIAEAVEQKHYPGDPPGEPVGIGAAMGQGLKLGALILVVNLLLLPFYIIFLFFPVLSLALYYAVNGWLMNKEYFELVATRHTDAAGHKALRRGNGTYLFLAGCVIAFLFSVPILNLVAPLIATAFMVHVFKNVERKTLGKIPGRMAA